MRKVDLLSSASQIRHALENLQTVWDQSSEEWEDGVSRQFREKHLEPMIPRVKLALDAMARMHEMLKKAQQDCEQ